MILGRYAVSRSMLLRAQHDINFQAKNLLMKNDPILVALINFLVPIIFIYGLFFLADFFENGFFAFIYSMVLLISGFMIFSVRASGIKSLSPVQFELISFFVLLVSISYICGVLMLITNLFSI